VVADVLARVRIVSLFVVQGSFYSLFHFFDAFNGNFSDDDNNNDILPKPFQGCSQT
jgi:hypothetical protein